MFYHGEKSDGQEGVLPAPFGPLPKGYLWAPGYSFDCVPGPPEYAEPMPMYCLYCSKYLDHMDKDCPHKDDDYYRERRHQKLNPPPIGTVSTPCMYKEGDGLFDTPDAYVKARREQKKREAVAVQPVQN